MEDGWIYITTSKQRKGMKEKIRAMPISPMLARILPKLNFDELKTVSVGVLTNPLENFVLDIIYTIYVIPLLHAHKNVALSVNT